MENNREHDNNNNKPNKKRNTRTPDNNKNKQARINKHVRRTKTKPDEKTIKE